MYWNGVYQMLFDGIRQPNTLYVADVSRGKDSTAMLRAIKLMNWPLDAVISVDMWATKDIPAELPPMVAFKDEWDKKCLKNFGVQVTRVCARDKNSQLVNVEREREQSDDPEECHSRRSYEDALYTKRISGRYRGSIWGFPNTKGAWCKKLKYEQVDIRGCVLQKIYSEIGAEQRERERERIYGFPMRMGNWCTALKTNAIKEFTGFQSVWEDGVTSSKEERLQRATFPQGPRMTGRI